MLHLFATYLLDGRHEDNRRAARIATRINNSLMNHARLRGATVKDELYQTEDAAMPKWGRKARRIMAQSWAQMKDALAEIFQR